MLSFLRSKPDQPVLGVQLFPDAVVLAMPGEEGRCDLHVRPSSPEMHSNTLVQLVEELNLSGALANVVLYAKDHKAYLIDQPPVPREEQAEAAKWRVRDMLDFNVEEAVVDAFDYPQEALRGRAAQINVRVARQRDIESILEVVRTSGLTVNKITTVDMALTALLLANNDRETKGEVILYLGPDYGLFLFVREQQLYLAREFEFPFAALNDPSRQENYLNQLTLEVQRSFDYLESQMGLAPPKVMKLSAPDARLPLANMMGGALGVEIVNYSVEVNLESSNNSNVYGLMQQGLFAVGAANDQQEPSTSVNLYTEQFHPQRQQLGLAHILMSAAATIVVVLLLYIWQNASLDNLRSAQKTESTTIDMLREQIEALNAQEGQLELDPQLVAEVERLRDEIDAYQSLLSELGQTEPEFDFRYSLFLDALALHRPERLWLTEFAVNNVQGTMNIQGHTVDAPEIPAFLQDLQTEPMFASKSFGSLLIDQSVDEDDIYSFQLHTLNEGVSP